MLSETTNGGTEILWDGNLQSTNINNFDLRWELFKKNGNNVSLSAFFKTLQNPIEIVQFLADPGSFQPRNVGDARIIGGEFEFKKSLGFVSPTLEKLAFNANFTYTQSSILISETEKRSRTSAAREGEVIADRRTMAGQAPWILNGGLSWNDKDRSLEAGVFYNVQGPTLMFVGFGNRANVYSVPFHSLNVNVSKNFGKEERMSLGIKASNLLNDWKEQIFSSYQAQDQYFQRLRPGTSIGVKFGYKF
jgi:outer membrane receptor protein involved in Fe transport